MPRVTISVLVFIAATLWVAGCSSGEQSVNRAEAPPEPAAIVVVTDTADRSIVIPSSPDTLVSGRSRDSLHAWMERSVPVPESLRALVERSLPNLDSLHAQIRRGLHGGDSSWALRFGPNAPVPPGVPVPPEAPFIERFRFEEDVEIDSLVRGLRKVDSLALHRHRERLQGLQAERLHDQARRLESQTQRLEEQAERLEQQAERLRDEAQRLEDQRLRDNDQRPAPDPNGQ